MRTLPALCVAALVLPARGQDRPATPPEAVDWRATEAPFLTGHVQLTRREDFVKAGEAYFNRGTSWIVFQAVPAPAAGQTPDEFYSIYAAKLVKDEHKAITGIEKPILLSPPGSWNSCAWFSPLTPWEVVFSSTMVRPKDEQPGGFQVGERKYTWMFPVEADIVGVAVPEVFTDISHKPVPGSKQGPVTMQPPQPILTLPDYQAECSLSPDGRFLLYAGAAGKDPNGRANIDIFVRDLRTEKDHVLVAAPGYDGGPFFSADGKRICYRSDRHLDDLLQIFTADLRFEGGVPVGITRESQLTDNGAVNWAPYWHPSGQYLIYGSSEVSHYNYEVYAVEADPEKSVTDRRRVRITTAPGADVLPVFSHDGSWMMWTGQRGPMLGDEKRASSQLWVARVTGSPFAR